MISRVRRERQEQSSMRKKLIRNRDGHVRAMCLIFNTREDPAKHDATKRR